jgi:hypothetical protein
MLGPIETDGDFVFASARSGRLDWTIVNLTKALYSGRILVEGAEGNYGLGYDAKPDRGGIGKMRYWRDRTALR